MLLLLVTACSDEPGVKIEENTLERIELSRSEEAIVSANQSFAFNLLRESNIEAEGENVLVSPFSMSCAWTMVANGAKGDTQNEILNALGFNGQSIEEANSYF